MTLPEDHFRLVSVLGADGDHLSLTRKHIRPLPSTASSTHEPYIALSYTWGTEYTDLVCDDAVFTVSSNLSPALASLHTCFPNRLIWTDTLSINQTDAGEKRYQVGIMGRIFSQADLVAVWLGEEAAGIYEELVRLSGTDPDDTEASTARTKVLTALAQCAWFYRAWTFQEIRLARRAVALFGDRYVPWTDFIDVVMRVRRLEPGLSTMPMRSSPHSASRFRPVTQDRFFAMIEELNSGTSNDLADLLFLTWYRDASEKRDKVYALLGAELLTRHHGIKVDYEIGWSALCVQSVRAALNLAQNLKVLKYAGMTRRWKSAWTQRWDPAELSRLVEHPSWAPDWWAPPQSTRSPGSFRYSERGVFGALDFCCPKIPPRQDVSNTGPLLVVPGVVLGLINADQEPTYPGGPTLVHPPPPCSNFTQEVLVNPDNDDVAIPRTTTYAFLGAVEKHLRGECLCFPPISVAPRGFGVHTQAQPPKLKFSNTSFSLHHCASPPDRTEDQVPAQVLAESVESGDWLVLFEGSSDPLVVRPVKDRSGRIVRPHEFSGPQDVLTGEEGLFMLVGEASMCWDELWPRQWSLYCRACSFVLI